MTELQDKMESSAYCIAVDPGSAIDLKVAAEVGMMVLLDKPIVVIVPAGRDPTPGLTRIAHKVVRLTEPLTTMASQTAITAALEELRREYDG